MSYRMPGRSGPPPWLVILTAAMLVFGGYFIWSGIRTYLSTSVPGVVPPVTEAARVTVGVSPPPDLRFTPPPTRTPVPACQDFVVTVPEAIIRQCPSTTCAMKGVRHEGDIVCVLEREYTSAEWYIIDLDDSPFFTDVAYMHQSIIRAVNPTPTPSVTMTALPTLTPLPSSTPLPTPPPTDTPNPATPPTSTPTFTPSPTPPLIIG